MTPEVQKAIREIQEIFSSHQVEATEDGQGGAFVIVGDLPIGEQYIPSNSWVGFRMTFQYPNADVYPHYIDGSLRRKDGRNFGQGLSRPRDWQGRSAIQVSRRSNRLNPAVDTAATKLTKVLSWLQNQ